jgi:hypothetical protein
MRFNMDPPAGLHKLVGGSFFTLRTTSSDSTFSKGATTVTCTATDDADNPKTCSFTVTVNDTQPPDITCPANINVLEPTSLRRRILESLPARFAGGSSPTPISRRTRVVMSASGADSLIAPHCFRRFTG